ncbi:MAG: hypothetical protein RML93_01315 [Anaerolineales bacterium]|nr:STAS/SEC14 domain-containing protein [Anaerolineales bacterium]MCS7248672.1 STAS/SEC14 domain-containing protein [Anaerolineales bacterium]MDW8162485.1 hypothetical protein [Anaerolineales bacterium]MDW8445910.1 hypothetical protein [Anaerolineales bacterium]
MAETTLKPLNWKPEPGIGYTVQRRADGGMHYVFTDVNQKTLHHWREFALQHLLDSDRLTRNLYDLRAIQQIPPEAIQIALELNADPAARNIRVAVVVGSEEVRRAVEEVEALTAPAGVELGIFTDIEQAEAWLSRPLTQLI